MDLTLIAVPYDSGSRSVRMGTGPEHLIAAGLPDRLVADGHAVRIEMIEHSSEPPAEIRTGFDLMRQVARHVRNASARGSFPIVLSGNCNVAIGSIGGLVAEVGIVWLDAHPDFQTPDSMTGGFLDATGLATATGRCWSAMAATVPGFRPVPESHVALVGVHDFQPEEREALKASNIAILPPGSGLSMVDKILDDLVSRVEDIYLHIDLDVLDPSYGAANEYAAPGGLNPSEVCAVVAAVSRRLPVRAIGIASFDPTHAPNGPMTETAVVLILKVVALAAGSAP